MLLLNIADDQKARRPFSVEFFSKSNERTLNVSQTVLCPPLCFSNRLAEIEFQSHAFLVNVALKDKKWSIHFSLTTKVGRVIADNLLDKELSPLYEVRIATGSKAE
ncbi:hypothetical protein D918_04295 [Trichuris suis]|nr:hypothetical protein D918_04295 [Trichuris suis]